MTDQRSPKQINSDFSDSWPSVLLALASQLPKSSFDGLGLARSVVIADGVVQLESQSSRDWVSARLGQRIEALAGQPVRFVVAGEQLPAPAPTRLTQADTGADQLTRYYQFDVLAAGGYSQVSHYITTFYTALWGSEGKTLWDYVRTFYKTPREVKGRLNPEWSPWTSPQRFRAGDLLGAVRCGKKKLFGRWQYCGDIERAFYDDGEVWETCRGCLTGAELVTGGDHLRCRRWRLGVLAALAEAGVLLIEREGDPKRPASIYYWLQVYQPLPLLTPAQVEELPAAFQDSHARFLTAHGVSVMDWQRDLTGVASLLPMVVSYSGATLRKLGSNDPNLNGDGDKLGSNDPNLNPRADKLGSNDPNYIFL